MNFNQRYLLLGVFLILLIAGVPTAMASGDGIRMSYNIDSFGDAIYADSSNEELQITATNPGSESVTRVVQLWVKYESGSGGYQKVAEKEITVRSSQSKVVKLGYSYPNKGKYSIQIRAKKPNADEYTFKSFTYVVRTVVEQTNDLFSYGHILSQSQYGNDYEVNYPLSFKDDAPPAKEYFEQTGIPPFNRQTVDGKTKLVDTSKGNLERFSNLRNPAQVKKYATFTDSKELLRIGLKFEGVPTGERQSFVFTHGNTNDMRVDFVNALGQEIDDKTTYKIPATESVQDYDTTVIDLSKSEREYLNKQHHVYVIIYGTGNYNARGYCAAFVTESNNPAAACNPQTQSVEGIYFDYKVTKEKVTQGETIGVPVTVQNRNPHSVTVDLTLYKDKGTSEEKAVRTKTISLDQFESKRIQFYTEFKDSSRTGTHTLTINKLDKTEITVIEKKFSARFTEEFDVPQYTEIGDFMKNSPAITFNAGSSYNGQTVTYIARYKISPPSTSEFTQYDKAKLKFNSEGTKSTDNEYPLTYDPDGPKGEGKGTYQIKISDSAPQETTVVDNFEPVIQSVTASSTSTSMSYTVDLQDDSKTTRTSTVKVTMTTSAGNQYSNSETVTFQYDEQETITIDQSCITKVDYKVTVTDDDGQVSDTHTGTFQCNQAPVITNLYAEDITEDSYSTIDVDAYDPDGYIVEYQWKLEKSWGYTYETTTDQVIYEYYSDPGTYTVKVTAVGSGGETTSETAIVDVDDETTSWWGGGWWW